MFFRNSAINQYALTHSLLNTGKYMDSVAGNKKVFYID